VGATVCCTKILGHWETSDTLLEYITYRVVMSIEIETLKFENERAAETDLFRIGDTAYKRKLMSSEQVIQHTNEN